MRIPILYSFRRCPYAIRARMALHYNEIVYEHREILLKNRPQKLYDISSKGTVPVLDLNGENIIDESLDIMKWALNKNNNQEWYVDNLKLQDILIIENDSNFKKWLDLYKYHTRYPEFTQEYYRGKCKKIIENYEKKLNSSRYLISSKESLSDIAIFPFIRQFANVELSRFKKEFPKLSEWLNYFIESDLFNRIMYKFEEWDQVDAGVIINYSK
tara:strand:- start:6790 stop:7431 length:642 start_codon:yes stop_codon:yes gene_type:complete